MRARMLAPLATVAVASTAHAQPVRFSALELPHRTDDRFGWPVDLNNVGWVLSQGSEGPAIYRNGLIETPFGRDDTAHAIGDGGHVVGRTDGRPFLWDGTDVHLLETIPFGSRGVGLAVNRHGAVAGIIDGRSVIWNDGPPRAILTGPSVRGTAAIQDMNAGGDVVGSVQRNEGLFPNGFLYRDGQQHFVPSVPGAEEIEVVINFSAVNDRGLIAGSAGNPNFSHAAGTAFTYDGESFSLLPDLAPDDRMTALDLNEDGWVVGAAVREEGDRRSNHAVIWMGGEVFALNDLVVGGIGNDYLNMAMAMNERGQILVNASTDRFGYGGTTYLLTPIPAPAATPLLLALLAGRRRRPARV